METLALPTKTRLGTGPLDPVCRHHGPHRWDRERRGSGSDRLPGSQRRGHAKRLLGWPRAGAGHATLQSRQSTGGILGRGFVPSSRQCCQTLADICPLGQHLGSKTHPIMALPAALGVLTPPVGQQRRGMVCALSACSTWLSPVSESPEKGKCRC